MTAKLISFILPLLAPTVLYFIWIKWAATHRDQAVRAWPWFYLIGAGLILASVATFSLGLIKTNPDPGVYVPPRMENGELVPGQFLPKGAVPENGAAND